MPRRRGGGGFGFGSSKPSPPSRGIGGASRPISTAPSRAPPAPVKPQVPAKAAPSQPGMLSQIAGTAAGVAIGHTMGHAMVGAMSGGSGEETEQTQPSQGYLDQPSMSQSPQQQIQASGMPCARELEDFIKCTQTASDLKFCEGLNYMLKQCKMDQGFA